jgi:hypothetical protein
MHEQKFRQRNMSPSLTSLDDAYTRHPRPTAARSTRVSSSSSSNQRPRPPSPPDHQKVWSVCAPNSTLNPRSPKTGAEQRVLHGTKSWSRRDMVKVNGVGSHGSRPSNTPVFSGVPDRVPGIGVPEPAIECTSCYPASVMIWRCPVSCMSV